MVKDVNPQFWKEGSVTLSAANTYTDAEFDLPIIPNISRGKVLVLEVLKVYYMHTAMTSETDTGRYQIQIQVTRDDQTAIVAKNSDDLLFPQFEHTSDMREIGTSANMHTDIPLVTPFEVDVSDGNGNGIILPHRQIYIGVDAGNGAAALTGTVWLLYRLKEIEIGEFLGEIIS